MKRRRLTAALGAATLVAAFAATYYVLYLKQQTTALLAARKTPEAVERYARIQDAVRQSAPVQDRESSMPAANSYQADLLQPIKQAEAVYSRVLEEIVSEGTWDTLLNELLSRPVSSWSEADWERLNTFLAEHADLLAEIRAMAATSGPLYPLDLSKGYAMELPHLAPTRNLARLLRAEAIALGHAGNFKGAAADIVAGLQLGARIREEPLLISQLVGEAIDGILYDGVADAFPEGQIPPELAAEIARYAHAASASDNMLEGIRSEHNIGLEFMAQVVDSDWQQGEDLLDQLQFQSAHADTWGIYLYTSPLGRPWQHLDAQAYGRIMSEFEATLGLPYYEARPVLDGLTREVEALPASRLFTRTNLPGLFGFHQALARDEARQQILLVGIALESYANENGSYPPHLEDIQGQANGASLIDPFTGEPFHYTPTANGFELYSVGRNLDDDGGRHDLRDGDIVWRGEEAPKATAAKVAARG